MDFATTAKLWDAEPGWLNTASYGLPPRPAFEELQAVLTQWRHGSTDWKPWDASVGRSRAAFARLVGAPVTDVSVGSTVSQIMSVVATALPPGARVVVPEVEFTSNLFPWAVAAEVVTVPADRLADAITPGTAAVAFSLVQSATGEVAPLADIVAAARAHDALVFADGSQACGWLPVGVEGVDALACAAYKWLMAPRGRRSRTCRRACASACARWPPTGTRARTRAAPTTARRCGCGTTRGPSTCPRRGSPSSARLPRWSC
ncbi:aminotransferase class V-fold PLP-dependent enzyme [Nonomuraea antimicrobica]